MLHAFLRWTAMAAVPIREACLSDSKTAFAQMKYLRDQLTPEPFESTGWTPADRVYMERRYRQLGHSISDQATEFLKANGFHPGGIKKRK